MQIIITMAGLGSRFRMAGFNLPKYMIETRGKSLFDWALSSLQSFKEDKHYFIVRSDDDAREYITQHCTSLGISNFQILEIDCVTSGQAETVLIASDYLNQEEEILIYNIDTYVEPNLITMSSIRGDGFIPCFGGNGDHWSFVKVDESGKAVEVREKVRISDNCTIGAYYFKSFQLYVDLYYKYYIDTKENLFSERYVAPLYNQLIDDGGDVHITVIPVEKVHVLGTPEEVDYFTNNYCNGDN